MIPSRIDRPGCRSTGAPFSVASTRDDLRRFLERRMRVFFSVGDWVGCMATMSVAIGSRFHGNVAALLAGTPALFLVHDMRTRELCELMRLPHIILDREIQAEEILERASELDYEPFAARFEGLAMEWRLFLARNGLELAFHEAEVAEHVAA